MTFQVGEDERLRFVETTLSGCARANPEMSQRTPNERMPEESRK